MTRRECTSRTFRRLALLAAWALAAPAVESATNDPLAPPDLADYVRWGPVRVRPSVGSQVRPGRAKPRDGRV